LRKLWRGALEDGAGEADGKHLVAQVDAATGSARSRLFISSTSTIEVSSTTRAALLCLRILARFAAYQAAPYSAISFRCAFR
jgi:hypothetical protein